MADWSKQRYWEDVQEGDEVPPVTFNLTFQRMVMMAGANRDFSPLHHNSNIARAGGADDTYLNNGSIQTMWERTVREFIGLDGKIKKMGPYRLRVFNTLGESVVTKGTVRRRWQEAGENLVELEIWSEHSKGVSVGPGPIVVTLPSRAAQ